MAPPGKIPIRRSLAGLFALLSGYYFPLNAGAAVAMIIAKAETAVMLIQTSLLTWRRRILWPPNNLIVLLFMSEA